MNNLDRLKEKISAMPDAAGVYLMQDKAGKVIYIGKAKSLKKRLRDYLGRDLSAKTVALMSNVADIEYKACPTESLALLLEAGLVHQYKPKYNVSLRDDKSFPFVKITHEEFPAIYITRKREKDAARYLGPYTNVKLLRYALKIIRRNFPYRSCRRLPKKACIYYRLKLSPAPCIGKISKGEYTKTIKNISLALEGKTEDLLVRLSAEMNRKSSGHDFEGAAKIRDQIYALSALGQGWLRTPAKNGIQDLRGLLKLDRIPFRIEAFDISNISGQEACGSMVSFYNAQPDKNNYRRFRIKTVEGIDDYKMLSEVVQRRYAYLLEEKLALPDLILIDGGRSHLLAAQKQLQNLGLKIPLVSIAKDKENIYTETNLKPIKLDSDTAGLNLIRRIRDEAHRFALSYHHVLRRKKVIGR